MIDIRRLREDPDAALGALAKRGSETVREQVARILELDAVRRRAIGEVGELKARRNQVSKTVGELKRAGQDADDLVAEMKGVGERIDALDAEVQASEGEIRDLLLGLPNLPLDEVQVGDESANQTLRAWGAPPTFDFTALPHWELGERLGLLDLGRGSKISGSGFPVLRGLGARLQRVLIDFMIDLHTRDHGYTEVRVPYLVTRTSMEGTGQLPKFAEESYLAERDDLWLIPTAEVPVTNLHRDELLAESDLPVRYVAYSPCFRREAGAAGKDTRGLLRVHQFDKVELVRYETAERSREALEELTGQACRILELLELPHRVVRLASGDLGFSSAMTFDIEVWAPGVERWLEVSSCSTFTDYQARRANVRYRPSGGGKPEFVHTLNGSALALPRLMVALLENWQSADGTVRVPPVLRPSLGTDVLSS
ncbi:MAG: serine--tRNA ligase [Gemmatimonadota bacterium]